MNTLKNYWWTFQKSTSLCHYLTLSVSWQQHVGLCCLVDKLLGKMTMIYGITWLIKCCLKLKLLCKLSVPFGNSPSQDKNKKTEDGILQSLGEINRLINLRLGLVFFVFCRRF